MPFGMLSPLPEEFIRFIGRCDVLGAAGLILPGLPRIRHDPMLLTAAGLTVIMAETTVTTLAIGGEWQR